MAFRKIIGVLSIASLGAFNLYGMGCSSSTTTSPNNPTDSGTKGDGSTGGDTGGSKDTGANEDTSSPDTGGGDAGMTCPDNSTFTAPAWVPPTAFTPGVCTTAQITTYATAIGAMTFMPPFTSGNMACDACIQTASTASKLGPVILISTGGMITDALLNTGGCIANSDGNATATGCGSEVNSLLNCFNQECGDCSSQTDFDTCQMSVQSGSCSMTTPALTAACLAEIQNMAGTGPGTNAQASACVTGNGASSFAGEVEFFAGLWCGPAAADGGSPEAGPTEAGPVEAGEQ
jgi:hypothetical protein